MTSENTYGFLTTKQCNIFNRPVVQWVEMLKVNIPNPNPNPRPVDNKGQDFD